MPRSVKAHYDAHLDRFLLATGISNADADIFVVMWYAEQRKSHTATPCTLTLTSTEQGQLSSSLLCTLWCYALVLDHYVVSHLDKTIANTQTYVVA